MTSISPTDAERVENQRTLLAAIVVWLKDIGYPYDFSTPWNLPPAPLRPLIEAVWAEDDDPKWFDAVCQTVAEEGGWLTDDWTPPPAPDSGSSSP